MDDLLDIGKDESAATLLERFHETQYTSLPWKFWGVVGKPAIWATIYEVVYWGCRVGQAILLKSLVFALFEEKFSYDTYLIAFSFGFLAIIQSFCHHLYFFEVMRLGAHIRIIINGLVLEKITRLQSAGLAQISMGQIINIASNDAFKLESSFMMWPFLILSPLLVLAVLILLWREVGVACLPGIASFSVLNLIQTYIGRWFARARKDVAGITDDRVKVVKEILVGSQVVKMYNWEEPLKTMIAALRLKEINALRFAMLLRSFNAGSFTAIPYIASCLVFITYVLCGNKLDSGAIFVTLVILDSVRLPMGDFFGKAIQGISEGKIAMERLEKLLKAPELSTATNFESSDYNECDVVVSNGFFSWIDDLFVLKDINLRIRRGDFVMVCGPVGSSKSSLLMALLCEMNERDDSDVFVRGPIAYGDQRLWIFAATVRDNIVFNREYDENRYLAVCQSCELMDDFALLPDGDRTAIGERGVNLSGGQKARVALARAVYGDASVYLLDDPLSAVDPIVAGRIVENCIGGGLLASKTRILVTHQTQFLSVSDMVIVMNKGEIAFSGTYEELMADEFALGWSRTVLLYYMRMMSSKLMM